MQNVHVAYRPFPALSNSNGALAFAISVILCTGKFTEAVLAFNLHFQQLGINLQGNKVHHSKEREILV
jgi:hypothetical protein